MKPQQLHEFWKSVNTLKFLPRSGWKMRSVKDPETVASHSFGTALLSYMLSASESGIDHSRLLKMALLHDIAESVTGDITHHDPAWPQKSMLEQQALQKILAGLPNELAAEVNSLCAEFEQAKTREAVIVKQADKLDMFLTADYYEHNGYRLDDFYDQKYAGYNTRHFRGGLARDVFLFLKASRPKEYIKR